MYHIFLTLIFAAYFYITKTIESSIDAFQEVLKQMPDGSLYSMAALSEEIKREIDHQCKIVQLDLFPHQVGGHHCFLIYDDNKLCKPLDQQEHRVYQNFPECLKDFIPKFYGVVKVYFHKTENDVICYALPPECSYVKDAKRFQNWLQGMRIIKGHQEESRSSIICEDSPILFPSKEDMADLRDGWISIMKDRMVKHLQKKNDDHKLEKFMLLEDVSRTFKHPCVVDLKMGTRGFGDNDTKEKKERKQKRVDESTSGSLGVRVCGMQVYHPSIKKYVLTNKYKGREYKDGDFENCIKHFFFNGSEYRSELIPPVVERLKSLLDHLHEVDCYRFYCSSLLVMYDGDVNGEPQVEVRMIDFANSIVKEEESNYHVGPDRGYIFGVTSLIGIFSGLQDKLKT